MKRALVTLLAVGLAACAGAADLETPAETTEGASATTTLIAPSATEPAASDNTSTPEVEDEEQLTPVGEPVTPGSWGSEFPVEAAVQDLAERLNVAPASIEVVLVEEVTWRDGSLGCPQPGRAYTQALVNGTRIILQAEGRTWYYHSGGGQELFLCMTPQEPLSGGDDGGSGYGDY